MKQSMICFPAVLVAPKVVPNKYRNNFKASFAVPVLRSHAPLAVAVMYLISLIDHRLGYYLWPFHAPKKLHRR
jgi:hypothetical protein